MVQAEKARLDHCLASQAAHFMMCVWSSCRRGFLGSLVVLSVCVMSVQVQAEAPAVLDMQ